MTIFSRLLIIIVIVFATFSLSAQNLFEEEQELLVLFEKLRLQTDDSTKDSLNVLILSKFEDVLYEEASFEHGFESLRTVGIVGSPDGLLNIYNWNIEYADGTNRYFAFIQYKEKKRKAHELYRLEDNISLSKNLLNKELQNEWYGCLYYDLTPVKFGRETAYMLMGWDAADNFSNKKVIDVLHFNRKGPKLGMPIIEYKEQTRHRLVFEYAEQAKMLLHYNRRYNMIIWDHLSPSNSALEGKYEYYGPDGTQDGLNFEKGQWKYYPNIEPRNMK